MNLTLTPEQERFIQRELAAGNYSSVSDLLSAALNLLAQRHRYDQWVHRTCANRLTVPPLNWSVVRA